MIIRRVRPSTSTIDPGAVTVRPAATESDAKVVYRLWSESSGEHNEPVQLDRWGPGLPVLVDAAGQPVDPADTAAVSAVSSSLRERLDGTPGAAGDAAAAGGSAEDFELTPSEPGSAVRQAAAVLVTRPPDGGALIARAGDEDFGVVIWSVVTHPFLSGSGGSIELVYVRPPFRRAGVGTRLVHAARDELRARGVHSFQIEVPMERTVARRFWRAIGWREYSVVGYQYD